MKKILSFVLIALAVLGVYWFFLKDEVSLSVQNTSREQSANINQEVSPVPQTTPSRLTITKLGVDAFVESVGMDNQGRMDVPKDENNVAWYNLGFHPGEQGSAVVAGHFDSRSGGPAVFYNLTQLEQGDEISMSYPDGSTYTFVVTDTKEFQFDQVPLEEIFNSKDQPRLNLITCDGVFDQSTRNYTRRLVVYSVLKP